jgi:hypothetical protein
MPNYRDENIKLAQRIRRSFQYNDIRTGWLGKITATGVVNPNPMDGLDLPYIWVRFEQNGESVRAINLHVDSGLANVRVRVGRDSATGQLEVLGLAAETALELGDIAGTLNIPTRISDLIRELVDPLRIKPLRVRPGDAVFDVYVEGGYYWHNGELHGWTGDFINIAASVPGGLNTKRPLLIGIDPATDTLTSYDGTVVALGTSPARGKYFPQDVIAQTVNDAGNDILWIACIPVLSADTDWRDVLRVTALQFTSNIPALSGHRIRVNDLDETQRGYLNFIDGNGIDITGADDFANDESEITFTVNQGELSLANLGTRLLDNLSDVVAPTPSSTQILQYNGANWVNAPSTSAGHGIRVNNTGQTVEPYLNFLNGNGITIGGADDAGNTENELTFTVNQSQLSLANLGTRSFLNLSDVPASYSSQALKGVRVNAGATALEFYTQAFTLLSDVPSSYGGQALKLVRVNAGATALEFVTASTAGHGIRVNGTGQVVEANLNFLNGNGITIAGTDDPGNTENELTFTVNQSQLSLASLGTRSFLNLSDVPATYTSQALKLVRVNAGATALEFVTPSTVGHIIQDGTLTNYTQRGHLRFTNTSDATWTFSDDGATDATELTLAIVPQTFNWLSDVTISGVAAEDIPVYGGSAWVNRQYWAPTRSVTQATATTSVVDATLSHTLNANNAQIINGLNALGTVNQAGFNATATNGAIGISAHGRATGATGTVTGIAGGVFLVSQTGGGTVTGAAGVYIKSGVKSAGTLTTLYGQYIESQTAGATNYAIYTNAGTVQLNDQLLVSGSAGGRTQFVVTGANGQSVDIFNLKTFAGTVFLRTGKNGNFFVTAEANTGGPEAIFGVTGAAHTALTANIEWSAIRFNLGQTYQFNANSPTMALNRFIRIDRPTVTGATATAAFTRIVTFSIGGEPNISTNASATSALALYVERGRSEFGGQIIYPSMAASGTQIDGEVWQDSTRKMLTQFTSGINQYVGGMTWVKTNTTTLASSTTETDISGSGQGTLTLPANFFSTSGKTLRIKVWGYYGTDVSAPTIRIKIKFGSTVILDTGAQTATASVTNQGWDVEGLITCRTAGASGTVIAQGLARLSTSAIAAVLWDMETTGTTTIDTTATQAVTISWQWGTNHANNTASNSNMLLEAVA